MTADTIDEITGEIEIRLLQEVQIRLEIEQPPLMRLRSYA
jgi:hypothetical protein